MFLWVVFQCDLVFLTHFSLVDIEAVDKSYICLFLDIELDLKEPPSTNVDKAEYIKLIIDNCLGGDVSPDLGFSCFSLKSIFETDLPYPFHIDPLKAYFILTFTVKTWQ